MSDATTELSVEAIEKMNPNDRIRSGIYNGLLRYLKGKFKQKFFSQMLRPDKDADPSRIGPLCRLMGEMGCILDVFAADRHIMEKGQISHWNRELTKILSSDNPDSYINHPNMDRGKIGQCIAGAISLVTFSDLMGKAGYTVRVWDILAPTNYDLNGATDLILDLGDKNMYQEDIIRIVQLKAWGVEKAKIFKADCEEALKGRLQDFSIEDVRKIINTGFELRNKLGKEGRKVEVRPFLVVVPGYSNKPVDNIIGIVRDPSVARDFKGDAWENGLIPT